MDRHSREILWKSLLIWAAIIPLAILNGIVREAFLRPWLGPSPALLTSGILLSGLIFLMAWLFIPRLQRPGKTIPTGKIGSAWLLLTVAFETGMGLAQGASASEPLANYNPQGGNLWLFVVLFTGCAPHLACRIRGC